MVFKCSAMRNFDITGVGLALDLAKVKATSKVFVNPVSDDFLALIQVKRDALEVWRNMLYTTQIVNVKWVGSKVVHANWAAFAAHAVLDFTHNRHVLMPGDWRLLRKILEMQLRFECMLLAPKISRDHTIERVDNMQGSAVFGLDIFSHCFSFSEGAVKSGLLLR